MKVLKPIIQTLFAAFLVINSAYSQENQAVDSLNKKRLLISAGTQTLGYGATMTALGTVWYAGHAKSSFHWFDDSKEWLQMDKVGHAVSANWLSGLSAGTFRWAGMSRKKAAMWGTGAAFLYIGSVEIFDGYSQAWGASGSDLLANTVGCASYLAQELVWERQVFHFKYSYAHSGLAASRPNVLGSTFPERLVKDYNAQTYWMSVSPFELNPESKLKWAQVSLGYGAHGMLFATGNPNAERNWYLSLDVNWEAIETNRKGVKALFFVLNHFKLPFPALEVGDAGFRAHLIGY